MGRVVVLVHTTRSPNMRKTLKHRQSIWFLFAFRGICIYIPLTYTTRSETRCALALPIPTLCV